MGAPVFCGPLVFVGFPQEALLDSSSSRTSWELRRQRSAHLILGRGQIIQRCCSLVSIGHLLVGLY